MRKQARAQSEGGEENLETQVWRMGVVKDTDQRESWRGAGTYGILLGKRHQARSTRLLRER